MSDTNKPLGWTEIRDRAIRFAREWKDETSEQAEAKSFWDAFFRVFGRERRHVAVFEAPVRRLDQRLYGRIDLFWRGTLLVEHKSAGHDLGRAESQAFQYIEALINEGRAHETPRYVLVSDFAHIALNDLDEGTSLSFPIPELYRHVHAFAFIAGYRTTRLPVESPANVHAAELMASLHDALVEGGYSGANSDRLLTRMLFCFFAEHTGIFDPCAFTGFVENRTSTDAHDLGPLLTEFFQVLNTEPGRRQRRLDAGLAELPYVNGALFDETLKVAAFDATMRARLLDCAAFDWSRISPAVFGSLFQSVMDPKERRQLGAHYTSERDILKILRSLFLDELETELNAALALTHTRTRERRLRALHDRLARLRFFDPACGCGNFLILAYRELRRLEQTLLVALHTNRAGQVSLTMDITHIQRVRVDQCYGVELLPFPAEIARVGMWLVDHTMNLRLSEALGQYFVRLPLTGPAQILQGNALRMDWRALIPPSDEVIVLGNPPFVGKQLMSAEQAADAAHVWAGTPGAAVLDYVACWYRRAAEYMHGTRARAAFVSTSSITQGEQPGALWPELFARWNSKIHFAYRSFPWASDARGRANVHVVIIGFGAFDLDIKPIVHEQVGGAEPMKVERVPNISPYLLRGPDLALPSRERPLCRVPACRYGSKPTDGGHLLLSPTERDELLGAAPELGPWIRPLLCAEQFLEGEQRYCLWLAGAPPRLLRYPKLAERLQQVAYFRRTSKKAATQEKAKTPALFAEVRQPSADFLAIPLHSSEHRRYIPFGYFTSEHIVHNSCAFVPDASHFHFGILSSAMHMAWVRVVCGRLESRYRYSTRLVYNNFPWPEATDRQRAAVTAAASEVLAARASLARASLAELYAPHAMPEVLVQAHRRLDRAVDRTYRQAAFACDEDRVEHLFECYQALTEEAEEG